MGAETQVGDHVRFVTDSDSDVDERRIAWGGNRDPRLVLVSTETYVVSRVEVHSWHTKVWVESNVGGELGPFNSTHFVRVAA